jgi:uncharacterized protein
MKNTKINVKVVTNSKQNKIITNSVGNQMKIKIKAKPINGKANDYLIKYLSKRLVITQKDIKIVRGLFSAHKTIEVSNLDLESIKNRIRLTQDEP